MKGCSISVACGLAMTYPTCEANVRNVSVAQCPLRVGSGPISAHLWPRAWLSKRKSDRHENEQATERNSARSRFHLEFGLKDQCRRSEAHSGGGFLPDVAILQSAVQCDPAVHPDKPTNMLSAGFPRIDHAN